MALIKTFASLEDVRTRFTGSAVEAKQYDTLLRDIDADIRNMQLNRLPFNLVDIQPDGQGNHPNIDASTIDAPADIDFDNYVTLSQWIPTWLDSARRCSSFVEEDFGQGHDANAHLWRKPVCDPTLAVVLGSGPSLNHVSEFLRDFPGYVIGGPSNAAIAAAHGRPQDAVLAIDGGMGNINHLRSGPFASLGTDLITNPTIQPDLVRLFPSSQRRWFMSMIQMGKGAQHNFNLFMKLLFSPIVSWMYQAGCTVNAEISFLHMLEVMGHPRFRAVYLLGVDFAYFQHHSRCDSFLYHESSGEWEKRDVDNPSNAIHTNSRIMRARNGMVCDRSMIEYKRSLLTLWAISLLPLVNCSHGIITELPEAKFEDYADGTAVPEDLPDERHVQNTYREYLESTGYKEGESSGFEGTEASGELWS
jgi:hypothetical protein